MSKPTFRKPKDNHVSDMVVMPGTVRIKEYQKGETPLGLPIMGQYQTSTLTYPEGHPMRDYRDKKKEVSRSK